MIDVVGGHVEVDWSTNDGTRFWLNHNGICQFRAYRPESVRISSNSVVEIRKLADVEREEILKAVMLKRDKAEAAAALGITHSYLIHKLHEYESLYPDSVPR